jgi:alkyl hydroperoxide reductase subunit AhpF
LAGLDWTGLMVVCADIFIMVGVDWCSHCEVFYNSGRDIAVLATSSTTLVSIVGSFSPGGFRADSL